MKCLPNIEITKKQFDLIEKQKCFDYGSESTIYEIPSIFGSHTLAKIWDPFYCSIADIYNKFEKIKRLYQIEELSNINDVRILKSISCRGQIVGYLMNKSNYRIIGYHPITKTELLHYLLVARQKLNQMEQLGIIYGDISNSNILVYQNDACFCDLDNVAYQELEMDVMSESLEEFMQSYGKVDEKAVSYMYNLFTLR